MHVHRATRRPERICSLIRCPSCRQRASGAAFGTLWHGLFDLAAATCGSVVAGVVAGVAIDSMKLMVVVAVVAFVVLLLLGNEARRWREAKRAIVQVVGGRRSQRQVTAPEARVTAPVAQARDVAPPEGPFRSPPPVSTPVIVTEKAPLPTTVPMAQDDSTPSEQPTFLR